MNPRSDGASLHVLEALDRPALFKFGRSSKYGFRRHLIMRALGPRRNPGLARRSDAALRARLLRLEGRSQEASEALDRLAAGSPSDVRARAFRWESRFAAGLGRASDIEFAVAAEPGDAWWRIWRAAGRLAELGPASYKRNGAGARRTVDRRARRAAEAALDDLRPALGLDPTIALAWALAARAHEDVGRSREAIPFADLAVRLEPRQAWTRQMRAEIRFAAGDREGYLADCDAVMLLTEGTNPYGTVGLEERTLAGEAEKASAMIREQPQAHWLYVARGNCRRSPELNDFSGALKDFEKALELRPDCPWAWAYLSRAQMTGRESVKAMASIDRAIDLARDCGWFHVWRGEIRRRLGDPRGAIGDFDRGLRLDPDYEFGYAWRGGARLAAGEPERALADLNLAAALDPAYDWTLHERSLVHRALGRTERALDDLDRAFRRDPKFVWCSRPADAPKAIAELDAEHVRRPLDARVLAWRGFSLRQSGRRSEAIADLRRAVSLDPRLGYARAWLGEELASLGRRRESLEQFEEAVRAEPSNPGAIAWRGRLKAQLGRKASGRRDLARAAELAPSVAWIKEWKGELELELKRFQAACDDFTAALELDRASLNALIGRSEALQGLGRAEESAADLRRLLGAAESLVRSGRREEASGMLNRLLRARRGALRAGSARRILRVTP